MLGSSWEDNKFIYLCLVFWFFECLGIEEILNNIVKDNKCILILNMDIFILFFVIKDCRVDII